MGQDHSVWHRLDRALSTPLARVLAWVVIVGLGAGGLAAVQEAQRDDCRRSNEVRTVDLPAAIIDTSTNLGEHLLGERDPATGALLRDDDGQPILTDRERQMIADYIAENEADLHSRFPARRC